MYAPYDGGVVEFGQGECRKRAGSDVRQGSHRCKAQVQVEVAGSGHLKL